MKAGAAKSFLLEAADSREAFQGPKQSLGDLSAETVANVIETATDIALVIDGEGVIHDVAIPASRSFRRTRRLRKMDRSSLERDGHRGEPAQSRGFAARSRPASENPAGVNSITNRSRGIEVPVLYAAVKVGRGRSDSSRSVAICGPLPICSTSLSKRRCPWSATTRACVRSRRAIGCFFNCRRNRP